MAVQVSQAVYDQIQQARDSKASEYTSLVTAIGSYGDARDEALAQRDYFQSVLDDLEVV